MASHSAPDVADRIVDTVPGDRIALCDLAVWYLVGAAVLTKNNAHHVVGFFDLWQIHSVFSFWPITPIGINGFEPGGRGEFILHTQSREMVLL